MNYFNTLPLRLQLEQLGKCRFMGRSEFSGGVDKLKGKSVVIVGCGAQGLNQGLNMRDSGLNISYALRDAAITERRASPANLDRSLLSWLGVIAKPFARSSFFRSSERFSSEIGSGKFALDERSGRGVTLLTLVKASSY